MTTLASDDFNRADSAALGGGWTEVQNTSWVIASNMAVVTSTICPNVARYDALTAPDDQWAEMTIVTPGSTTDRGAGLILRASPSPATGTGVDIYLFQANAVETRIYKRVSNSYTQLGTDGPAVGAGDVIYFEVQGDTLTAKVNGANVCGTPLTDTALTAGQPAIWSCRQSENDDWSFGDFAAAALTADPGALSLTGADATLTGTSGESLTADPGALTLTGQASALSLELATDPGTLTFTGAEALFGQAFLGQPGTLALQGADVSLSGSDSLSAAAGALGLTGAAAVFAQDFVSDPGALSLVGADATLQATSGDTLIAGAGGLTLTGATLLFDLSFTAEAGQLSLIGQAISFDLTLAADAALLALAGADATLTATGTTVFTADAGVLVLNGSEVVFVQTGLGFVNAPGRTFVVEAPNRTFGARRPNRTWTM